MNEWYVITEGYGTVWKPLTIKLGRAPAVREFVLDYRLTPEEKRKCAMFLEGVVCGLGEGLHLVGYELDSNNEDGTRERRPDRWLHRVTGPGAEV